MWPYDATSYQINLQVKVKKTSSGSAHRPRKFHPTHSPKGYRNRFRAKLLAELAVNRELASSSQESAPLEFMDGSSARCLASHINSMIGRAVTGVIVNSSALAATPLQHCGWKQWERRSSTQRLDPVGAACHLSKCSAFSFHFTNGSWLSSRFSWTVPVFDRIYQWVAPVFLWIVPGLVGSLLWIAE